MTIGNKSYRDATKKIAELNMETTNSINNVRKCISDLSNQDDDAFREMASNVGKILGRIIFNKIH